MKKIIYFILTYIVCRVLGIGDIWLGFAPFVCIILFTRLGNSLVWEIPIGTLICAIIINLAGKDFTRLLRILIPCGAVVIAYASPKRLALFFPAAVLSLFLKNAYCVAVMGAFVWCGIRLLFVKDYSTTTKPILQATTD